MLSAREEDATIAPVPHSARMLPHISARPGVNTGSSRMPRTCRAQTESRGADSPGLQCRVSSTYRTWRGAVRACHRRPLTTFSRQHYQRKTYP